MSSPATVASPAPLIDFSRPVRPIHGRTFSVQVGDYALPIDAPEQSRLDKQHTAIKLSLGSLYVHRDDVRAALTPSPSNPHPALIDLGTGSGSWALDMAAEFPHVDVTALDVAENTFLQSLPHHLLPPPNFTFHVGDATSYIARQSATFDVVHARSMEAGVPDFDGFLYDVARSLKSGGLLLLASGSPQLYREDRTPFPYTDEGEPGFTWTQRTMGAVYDAILKSGKNYINHPARWTEWLEKNPNFTRIETVDYYIPLGAYTSGMSDQEVRGAEYMRQAFIEIQGALKPLLLSDPEFKEHAEKWVTESTRELNERDHPPFWLKWRHTFAVRAEGEWVPRPVDVGEDHGGDGLRTMVEFTPRKGKARSLEPEEEHQHPVAALQLPVMTTEPEEEPPQKEKPEPVSLPAPTTTTPRHSTERSTTSSP